MWGTVVSQVHYDTHVFHHMPRPYGSAAWPSVSTLQSHMAVPYGSGIWQSHMAPYGNAKWFRDGIWGQGFEGKLRNA